MLYLDLRLWKVSQEKQAGPRNPSFASQVNQEAIERKPFIAFFRAPYHIKDLVAVEQSTNH